MAEKILVPLKRGEFAEEVVPYLEEVAKAGTSFRLPITITG